LGVGGGGREVYRVGRGRLLQTFFFVVMVVVVAMGVGYSGRFGIVWYSRGFCFVLVEFSFFFFTFFEGMDGGWLFGAAATVVGVEEELLCCAWCP